ncbi:MAG: hypothetical protein E6K36_06945 [Gammaproteobacteria bacterium]|nr:MAG: hypothetical protein E6K36_06945 [Gammaproteobacteria bacterium]
MWKSIRIAVLLFVLLGVAVHSWLDRIATQGWKETLWVGIFPLNGDGTPMAQRYVEGLTAQDFSGIEEFFAREAHRYGVAIEQPVHAELYPQGSELPPALEPGAGPLGIAWWSLKLRWFAAHATEVPGRASPRIRIFVLYHDPATLDRVPDSHGLQKGLIGVVHAFAQAPMAGSNNIVIAHELMHTLGASDKYDLGSGAPLYPIGFAEPDREPLYPQGRAEIMAGRRALSRQDFEMPQGLRDVVVGPATALEIRWTRP